MASGSVRIEKPREVHSRPPCCLWVGRLFVRVPPGRFDIGFASEGGRTVFIPAQVPRTLGGQRRKMADALLGRLFGGGRLAHAFENPGAQNIIWAGIGLAKNSFIHFFQREGEIAATITGARPN